MRSIKFRPLRRIKTTGKIVVASYAQWNKVVARDYEQFELVIDSEYLSMNPDEMVHDHKGEQLFWYNHQDPEKLPKSFVDYESIARLFGSETLEHLKGEEWKLTEPLTKGFDHSVRGFDCNGTPVFSHNTANYLATHYKDVTPFVPLTVGMVTKWLGWFLWRLENSRLQFRN